MKDTFCSYYTNSDDITSYMAKRLGIQSDDVILEPSAGEGIFIDELLKNGLPLQIDALDINPDAIEIMHRKYEKNASVQIRETDTLLDAQLDLFGVSQLWLKQTDTLVDEQLDYFSNIDGHYTKVIGNPPYGAWQDYEKRDLLKKKYAGHYVKETYALFLLRCISVLKNHGRLSFIIPDTFLFLNMHSRLREMLLSKTKIDEILIFPSKFFPGVSFGYSNLSIITLERCDRDEALANTIRIVQGFKSASEFELMFSKRKKLPEYIEVYELKQKEILNCTQHRFILGKEKHTDMLKTAQRTLGDVANVVTGFYTGDNLKFIRSLNSDVKGAKKYSIVDQQLICECCDISGIPEVAEGYIPYIKSSSCRRYLRDEDEWFVRWDRDTIAFYNSNKKSRFQNSSFYFKTGVAIPMVKSSTIRAFLMENRVFDQSIVGIFPKEKEKLYYILALMNSDTINELIHIINPTANNSSNYVKQLPYIEPGQSEVEKICAMVKELLSKQKDGDDASAKSIHQEINKAIAKIYAK